MNAFESFTALLPQALQSHAGLVLAGLVLFLVLFCWKLLRFVFRIAWAFRVILMVASVATYAGVNGCVDKAKSVGAQVVSSVNP